MTGIFVSLGAVVIAALWMWSFVYIVRNRRLTSGAQAGYIALLVFFPFVSIFPVWLLMVMGVGFVAHIDHGDIHKERY
jgi:hypothetical protein